METPKKSLGEVDNKLRSSMRQVLEFDPDNLFYMHPIDAMKQIDIARNEYINYIDPFRKKSLVRWFLAVEIANYEFGIWSGMFNRNLRARIKKLSKEEDIKQIVKKLKYVYVYWWVIYKELGEISSNKKPIQITSKIKKQKEILRNFIYDKKFNDKSRTPEEEMESLTGINNIIRLFDNFSPKNEKSSSDK